METLTGKLVTSIYENSKNEYKIIKVSLNDTREIVTISGYFNNLIKNSNYEFLGEWKNHPKYGNQFVCNSYLELKDNSKEGIINYL